MGKEELGLANLNTAYAMHCILGPKHLAYFFLFH